MNQEELIVLESMDAAYDFIATEGERFDKMFDKLDNSKAINKLRDWTWKQNEKKYPRDTTEFPSGFEKDLEAALKKALKRVIRESAVKKGVAERIKELNDLCKEYPDTCNGPYKLSDVTKIKIQKESADKHEIVFRISDVDQDFDGSVGYYIGGQLADAPEVLELFKNVDFGYSHTQYDGDEGLLTFYPKKK